MKHPSTKPEDTSANQARADDIHKAEADRRSVERDRQAEQKPAPNRSSDPVTPTEPAKPPAPVEGQRPKPFAPSPAPTNEPVETERTRRGEQMHAGTGQGSDEDLKKARYDSQDCVIMRAAKDGDNGFDPRSDAPKQVLIRYPDGNTKVVMANEVSDRPVETKPAT